MESGKDGHDRVFSHLAHGIAGAAHGGGYPQQQELDHWNNGVHFFKVILESTLKEEKLRVPISFVRRYWKGIENPVTLRLPNTIQKKVFWEKTSDYDVFFCNGWKEFANYLSLSESQFLVFQYQESSLFNVIVIDKNGLEIKYPIIEISQESTEIESSKSSLQVNEDPSPIRRLGRPKSSSKVCKKKKINSQESIEIESSESSLQVNEDPSPVRRLGRPKSSSKVCKKKKINPKEPKKSSKLENRKVQIDARFHNLMDVDNDYLKEKSRVLYDKVNNMFRSNKDFFVCMIQKTYIERNIVGIPTEFGRRFLHQMEGRNVTLFINKQKTWIVDLKLTSNNQYTLSGGWSKFRAYNDVKLGDVCVFILNKSKGKISFQVTNFSLEKDTSSPYFEGNTNIVPV
ncbi:B3 domain-containing transcription factor VRN1-like isoform X2 [Vicia villosa]|uniref:B3 domain-containing transcription factor VRN1-like isoform X2 n=1 Tax=Vicia villosa TaxID=3911 RepID=UPI00273AF4B8|nr:B3 domain-containing transcription factor VRN1-like isoform X2 [Vicia villosa]